ncbi:MAG: carboxypeptidase regulatory-like domain-containing protein [Vicinamibacterales bacterium]
MIRGSHRVRALLVCVVALMGVLPLRAAQKPTFDIEGVVTDAQQAVLPGATVTIRNDATGFVRVVTADASGRYVAVALPPEGRYSLQVELAGFASEVRSNLTFNAGQRVVLNFSLKLSTVQETITVTGEAPLVQTTSAEITKTIDSKDLSALPVAERNYFRVLTLDSNVVARAPGTNGLYVGGGDVWNFGTYVDGTNNFSKWLTLQRAPQRGSSGFALETVKEVQIITNQFSAEFGGHSAGVMSMITKSGTNAISGAGLVVIRPGDLDALPPLATRKAPYNQQQFGGVIGGPAVRDRVFYFGSYERRRERSQTVVTSLAAPGLVVPTPADEHQGLARADVRFSPKNSLAFRYNMVRWRQDNETGGLNLPGSGYIWDNNVDTLQGTFTTIASDRFLNEVRTQWSRYYDLRAAKCNCVQFNRAGYSVEGGNAAGTWGVIPEDTWDVADTISMWRGDHSFKLGGSVTYDVTSQRYKPNQNGIYFFRGSPSVAPTPFQFNQGFAPTPEAEFLHPRAYVFSSFLQDDWKLRNNFTLNLGLRYDVELLQNIPDWPAPVDRNNVDPRIGFAWDVAGDQKWAVRGGFGRFTQQHPIFTILKGAVGGRNGLIQLSLPAGDPNFPTFPNALSAFPPGAVLPARNIQEIASDLENEFGWQYSIGFQRQLGPRASVSVDGNVNRAHKHGFLDFNQPAPVPKDVINAAGGAVVRTVAQADLTRPIQPGPNGFRRMELLTNEGRSWYQGVRVGFQHRTTPMRLQVSYTRSKSEDRLNHWDPPEDSSDPELDRGPSAADTPHNFVAAATWLSQAHRRILAGWQLSTVVHAQSGNPYSLRYSGDLTGTQLTSCSGRGCNVTRPGARNTERGKPVRYADLALTRTFALPNADRIEFRADVFNVFNNQNFVADGYIGVIGNARLGQPTGGGNAFPGRQFQFAGTYRF